MTACSISHKFVVSNKFKALIIAVNPKAEHVLLRSSSLLSLRIVQPTQRLTFPALSQLVIDVLSAFAMSAELKRTFSKARRITSWERSQLSANTIKCSELLKDWSHRGVAYRLPNNYIDSDDGNDSEAPRTPFAV